MNLIVFTDGASRGNPGKASYGFTVSNEGGQILFERGEYIGIATNNVAEYTAVLEALKEIKKTFPNQKINIKFFADSKLAVEQLSGRYKIKSPHLNLIIQQIKPLCLEIGKVSFSHVPREKNTQADRLANLALDALK